MLRLGRRHVDDGAHLVEGNLAGAQCARQLGQVEEPPGHVRPGAGSGHRDATPLDDPGFERGCPFVAPALAPVELTDQFDEVAEQGSHTVSGIGGRLHELLGRQSGQRRGHQRYRFAEEG